MAVQLQMRRGTTAEWTAADPTLANGEWGLDTTTKEYYIGDGSTAWSNLTPASLPSTAVSVNEIDAVGDLLYGSADNAVNNLAVGTNGHVLTADSSVSNVGIKWAAPAAAAAGSLTGATLASGVTASSLTSVGTLTGLTMGGELAAVDQVISRPEIKDYAETLNAHATSGGTQTIDLSLGNVVTATVATSATTFVFDNPAATGKAFSFTLILTNGGSQTVTWPTTVDWAGGTAPTLTTSGVDILTFTTTTGSAGTPVWYGFLAGADMK